MPGHKVNLSIVKQIEIISSIFSDHICSEIRNQLKEENVQKKKSTEAKQYAINQQANH